MVKWSEAEPKDRHNSKLTKLEYHLNKIATRADPQTLAILQSIHGVGKFLSLTILYEIYSIDRFDTVQDFASYARLVKCQHESAGKAKALTLLSHKLGRAMYFMLKRKKFFEQEKFLATS